MRILSERMKSRQQRRAALQETIAAFAISYLHRP